MKRCDCGALRRDDATACDRCSFLDGTDRSFEIVQALRALGGGARIWELAEEIGTSVRQVYRWLLPLVQLSRVRRIVTSQVHRCEEIWWWLDTESVPVAVQAPKKIRYTPVPPELARQHRVAGYVKSRETLRLKQAHRVQLREQIRLRWKAKYDAQQQQRKVG